MKILGLDIGTTTISAALWKDGTILCTRTKPNGAFINRAHPWEKVQDAAYIRETALGLVRELFGEYPDIGKIGVTGQMHGIVYLDSEGNLLSPLYTWQDGSGEQLYDGTQSYASYLSALTGYPMSAGFGLVTHFYHIKNGLVPENTAVFCTIHDYIAMLLAGLTVPVTDASDAASFGLFDVQKGAFDISAVRKAGINPALLPVLAQPAPIGMYENRAAVYPAIGDNQASFLGACGDSRSAVLVNVGTGGQFSAYCEKYTVCPGLETRPFPGGGYLLVGSSLCSGRAYALLERFFSAVGEMLGMDSQTCYDAMAKLLDENPKPDDLPAVSPLFQGTRQNPDLCAAVTGLTTENFTPLHLLYGMLDGMAEELYRMYLCWHDLGGEADVLIGAGSGLRRNRHLQTCFAQKFGRELILSPGMEEAAAGAARFAFLH